MFLKTFIKNIYIDGSGCLVVHIYADGHIICRQWVDIFLPVTWKVNFFVETPLQSYRTSPAICDQTVLPAIQHRWTRIV